jgi:hypothetical protein
MLGPRFKNNANCEENQYKIDAIMARDQEVLFPKKLF